MKRQWKPDSRVPGLGVLTLPSGVSTYYLRHRLPSGKQLYTKLGRQETISLAAARQQALQLLAEPTERAPRLTVQELRELVEARHWPKLRPGTVANNRTIWKLHILPKLGARRVTALSTKEVADWFHSIGGIKANRCIEVLSKAWNLAIEWGHLPKGSNVCDGITHNSERKRKRRYMKRQELEALLSALDRCPDPIYAALIRLLMLTGARLREVMHARWQWLDWETRQLVIPASKHKTGDYDGEERIIHLPPAAIEILRVLRESHPGPWIIPGLRGGPLIGYRKQWLQIRKDAGLPTLRIHDLRHTYASNAITAGLTLPEIGELLGHRSPSTTAVYAHLIDDHAATLAARVQAQIIPAATSTSGPPSDASPPEPQHQGAVQRPRCQRRPLTKRGPRAPALVSGSFV